MALDWSKPLESAVSGKPLVLVTHRQNPDNNGDYHLQSEDGFPLSFDECGFHHPFLIVRENGVSLDGVLSVRNVAPKAPSCFGTLFYFGCERCRFESTCKPIAEMKHAEIYREPVKADDTKTLRDEFAMAALQYLGQRKDITIRDADHIASVAYEIADAMMQERAK